MKKWLILLLILSLLLTACAPAAQEPAAPEPAATTPEQTENPEETAADPANVLIAGLKGPTSMGMIRLIDGTLPEMDGYAVTYEAYGAPEELTGKLISGEIQIAAVPTNLASILYNKTQGKLELLNVNTLGVIHVVGRQPLSGLEDLAGKTLTISGKGATPDLAVQYMLEQAGLTDSVTLSYLPDHASLAQAVLAGDVEYAVLPQPFVTQVMMKDPEISLLVDLNEAWTDLTGLELVMGCLVIDTAFADENPAFVEAFLSDYSDSVAWVNEYPDEAGVLIETHGILPSGVLAAKAIPDCSIVFETASDAREDVDAFLEVLYGFNPASVGGQLPDEAFYFGH